MDAKLGGQLLLISVVLLDATSAQGEKPCVTFESVVPGRCYFICALAIPNMANHLSELRSAPAPQRAIRDLKKQGLEYFVPVTVTENDNNHFFGGVGVFGQTVLAIAHSQGRWNVIDSFDHANEVQTYGSDVVQDKGMLFTGTDGDRVKVLFDRLLQGLSSYYGNDFVIWTPFSERQPTTTSICASSEHIAGERRLVSSNVEGTTCRNCGHFIRLSIDDDSVMPSTMLNPDWILETVHPDQYIIANTGNSAYLLTSNESSTYHERFNRLNASIAMLIYHGSMETVNIGVYQPSENVEGSLYVEDQRVCAAIVTIEVAYGDLVNVVYVCPDVRSQGIAGRAMRAWYDNRPIDGAYYIEDASSSGKAIFESIGHYDPANPTDGLAIPAFEVPVSRFSLDMFQSNH